MLTWLKNDGGGERETCRVLARTRTYGQQATRRKQRRAREWCLDAKAVREAGASREKTTTTTAVSRSHESGPECRCTTRSGARTRCRGFAGSRPAAWPQILWAEGRSCTAALEKTWRELSSGGRTQQRLSLVREPRFELHLARSSLEVCLPPSEPTGHYKIITGELQNCSLSAKNRRPQQQQRTTGLAAVPAP